jgi:tRNA(Ile)-lysidine synthase
LGALKNLTIRARRDGDRMRPRGLGGSKSLQDLFTDRKVPRRLRAAHPVVCAGERILWVPGVAIAEDAENADAEATTLSAARLH